MHERAGEEDREGANAERVWRAISEYKYVCDWTELTSGKSGLVDDVDEL